MTLLPYPEEHAVVDTADTTDLNPTAVFPVLLPVWSVEVLATVTEAADYELIDRHLSRAMAHAGPHTAAELADFFSLDPVVTDRALRYLVGLGHIRFDGERYALTELGSRSVRDGRSYRYVEADRRVRYFDAYQSRPLPRTYHGARSVRFLTAAESSADPSFTPLGNIGGFRAGAVDGESLGEELRYLPLYVVRGVVGGGRAGYRAYGPVGADEQLSELCERTPEIVVACENDVRAHRGVGRDRIVEWLRGRGLAGYAPELVGGEVWRVTLPGEVFGGAVPWGLVGGYLVLRGVVCHVWCVDPAVRRVALVEQLAGVESVDGCLPRLSRRLRLDADPGAVREWAVELGHPGLADRLA